ncbi:UNVERIFIED_CONTAM: protein SAR DEFICIENT 1 [Sesamum latifolium]|uniref:Protein SAR DEFICIENT 1 n=1 Tax=Sesamum latifolium TaxID=2727402 RepID=A0AAW2UI39_9LAMI
MAAKRFLEGDDDDDEDPHNQKRLKTTPSFASTKIAILPLIHQQLVPQVSEEVENILRRRCTRSMLRSPSLRLSQPTTLQLTFGKKLSLPIFTGTKIVDVDANPLQVVLVEHDGKLPTSLPYWIKLEIVVLDGDFPSKETWSNKEFTKNIVKERSGKRPLLTGDLNITMRDGVASVGDIEFTDNSSWIRSRKFRVGREFGQTWFGQEFFVYWVGVKFFSRLGSVELNKSKMYKKHHPPALEDEVWRLEKIGKGGAFHHKLASHGINTVQDFLKLFIIDPSKLRKILGVGMSEKMWEATLKHAKTCVMGSKLYRYHHANTYTLTFTPVCQLLMAEFNGQVYYQCDFKRMQTSGEAYMESLVKDAYAKWNTLEEVDGVAHDTPLLTQGEVEGQHPNQQQQLAVSSYVSESSCSVMQRSDAVEGDYLDDWALNSGGIYLTTNTSPAKTPIRFFSGSSSECDNIP